MRKFTFFLTMLFATAMTAFAQNFADGVYEIKNADASGSRGYFVYSTEYPTTVQLSGVQLSGFESKHYTYGDSKTNSYWYLYTVESTGARYLFNLAEGHLLSKGADLLHTEGDGQTFYNTVLSKEIASPVTIEESTHRAGYYNLKVNGTHYLASSCGWDKDKNPVRLSSKQADGGNPLELLPVADVTVDAAVMAAVKAVIDPTAVEPEPEPVVELYRLKNENGYLNVSNNLSHPTGPAGGVNVVDFADSDDQKFTIEDAGNGQVYLKSVSGYYIYCEQWNVDGSADNKTALTFESNGENTFYLKQAGGYFKVENVNVKPVAKIDGVDVEQPAVSGWYPYCDAGKSAAATWSLEKVEETPVAPSYTATVDVNDAAMGSATVTVEGSVATFTATPNEGYKFAGWLMDGFDTGNVTNPLVFDIAEMGVTSLALVAKFEALPTVEPSAEFEWASKTNVLIEAEGYYGEVLGTMYTLTADVTTDDATTFPASFDFGLGYYPGYDDGAGYVVPAYYYVAWYNTYRADGYYCDMVLEPAADGKTATIDINKSYISGGNYIYDASFGKSALTLTANEDGTISMSDFVVSDGDALEALATYKNVKLTKKAIVPPTELTVKGYSPKKEVKSLETIEIEFSDAIATRISGSTGILCPDGHTEYFMNREMDGKVLRLTLNPAQTAEGTYTLTIPAGVIKNAEGLEYAGGEFTFTVKQPKYLVGEIDPADKSSVESLSRIVFTYADGTSIYANNAEQITVTDKDGNSVSTAIYNYSGLGWNQIGVLLNTPITTVGTYTVTIPEGLIYDYLTGDISPYTLTYTVEEPKAPTDYTHSSKKNVHAARALQSFTIANLDTEASMKVEDIQVVGAGSPVFVDKTAQVLEVQPGNTIYFSEFTWAGEWMHGYAFIDYNHDFIFDSNLNADGTTGGELVSYNHYNDKTSLGTASDSHWANTIDYEGSMGLPYFVLPADLAAGDYRMRIKIDWNNIDANGTSDMHTNGGCQCDFILRVAGAVEPEPELPTSYVYFEGTNNHDVRALKSFTIADVDTEASMTVENIQVSGGKSPVYVDKTENVFEVKAGSTLYFSEFDWAGEWMHAYAYIDYNKDFTFDTNLNADGTTGGEVVSYNSFDDKTSWGNAVSGGKVNAGDYEGSKGLPHFVLPADLAAGDYRMRIKIDWNRLDANFGDAVENNPKTYGGCQCDIVIRIVGDEPTPPAKKYIEIVNVIPSDNSTVASLSYVQVEFDQNEYIFVANTAAEVKDAAGNVVTTATVGYKNEAGEMMAAWQVGIVLDEAITEAGTYTITLPEGAVNNYIDGNAEATFTFTVDPTLGINGVDAEGEQVIYDITGRRIEKINAAGVYIVNGVKVLVK